MRKNIDYKKQDNWTTPKEYWKCITKFIPDNSIIIDPFFFNGDVKNQWKQLGYDIIHEDNDFFKIEKNDCNNTIYITNPPYSILLKCIKHLFYLDKPFILLIPIQKIAQLKIQKELKKYKLQLIICSIYKGFIDQEGNNTRCPSQYFCYLCYKLNLDQDLIFL